MFLITRCIFRIDNRNNDTRLFLKQKTMRQAQIRLILIESISDNKVEAVCGVLGGVLRIGQILYAPNSPKVISISRTPGGRNLKTATSSIENYVIGIEGDTTLIEGKLYNTFNYGEGGPVFKKAYSH